MSTSHLQENIEEEGDSASKEADQCMGVVNAQTSENQGQVAIDNRSSEEVSDSKDTDQCLVAGSTEISANQDKVTIDDHCSEEQNKDSSSKATGQCLDVANPETSANQGQVTNDNPSSDFIEDEISDSKETDQCLGAVSTETLANHGQVTIDDPASEEQKEDLNPKETDQCLGVANPETPANQGQVTNDDPIRISSENIEEDSASKETEQALGAVSTVVSGNQQGQVTIDKSSSENIEEQERESGLQETKQCSGQVSSDDANKQEDLGSEEKEQCSGVASADTSASQGQITTAETHEEDLGVVNPENLASQGQDTIDDSMLAWRIHKVSYEFYEIPYTALATCTRNFAIPISSGSTRSSSIYIGSLTAVDRRIAVKVLTGFSRGDMANLAHNIARATHPNIVKFLGYCNEQLDSQMLVYEFVPKNLFSCLHGTYRTPPQIPPLDWAVRMKIIHGVAKALHYLHKAVTPPVIYGGLSSLNILLDEVRGSFHPKLCGFGFRKLKHAEYCLLAHGDNVEVSTGCDIYCFGVVFLELLTGRMPYVFTLDSDPWLPRWVMRRLVSEEGRQEVQDPALKGTVEHSTFWRALTLAMLCCSVNHMKVRDIEEVVDEMEYITGEKVDGRPLPEPGFLVESLEIEADEEEGEVKKTNKSKKKKNKKNKKKKK